MAVWVRGDEDLTSLCRNILTGMGESGILGVGDKVKNMKPTNNNLEQATLQTFDLAQRAIENELDTVTLTVDYETRLVMAAENALTNLSCYADQWGIDADTLREAIVKYYL